jgi:hypothetical protein
MQQRKPINYTTRRKVKSVTGNQSGVERPRIDSDPNASPSRMVPNFVQSRKFVVKSVTGNQSGIERPRIESDPNATPVRFIPNFVQNEKSQFIAQMKHIQNIQNEKNRLQNPRGFQVKNSMSSSTLITTKIKPSGKNSPKGSVPDPNNRGNSLICHNIASPHNPEFVTVSVPSNEVRNYGSPDYDGKCTAGDMVFCSHGSFPDCNGVCGGPSVLDCGGHCYDPTDCNDPPLNLKDCAGVCYPKGQTPPNVPDCAGVCGGSSFPDCKGICGGQNVVDCNGVCGGDAFEDCSGQCRGGHHHHHHDDNCGCDDCGHRRRKHHHHDDNCECDDCGHRRRRHHKHHGDNCECYECRQNHHRRRYRYNNRSNFQNNLIDPEARKNFNELQEKKKTFVKSSGITQRFKI